MVDANKLKKVYQVLRDAFGHRDWWPARSPFEVMVGAVLTQNTNWKNVEKAIENLRQAGMLKARALAQCRPEDLQELIRSAGYYRQKTARLLRLARWVLQRCEDGELEGLRELSTDELRRELVGIKGIGPETADSIVLYALERPVFVVDAYTVRVLGRHGMIEEGAGYREVQELLEAPLPADLELYKDFHAQFVQLGKTYCRSRAPQCAECPLHPLLGDPVPPCP